MKKVVIKNVSKSFGNEVVFSDLNLEIPGGTFFALLGPSGCGKTTLLRMLAGFESPDSGSIYVGDTDIVPVPANKRSVNTVFQNYALFPHLNVFDNVAYSLCARGEERGFIKEKVMKFLVMMHLEEHANKKIQQLSGGQQQRVAIARAIINEPAVLLLDEPLSALDVRLRERVLVELIDLQDKLGTTFIYITHDQNEALTVADQMAIMSPGGRVEQVGKPKEIYEFPKSLFVAQFVGETNILRGQLNGDMLQVTQAAAVQVVLPESTHDQTAGHQETNLSIRPEKIKISRQPLVGFSNELIGTVDAIVYYGRSTQYKVNIGDGLTMQVVEQNQEHFEKETIDYDDKVYLYWQKENGLLLAR
jgi:spermidine/putrescine transport system ATP-binding protein